MLTAKLTSKGQITIPSAIRKELGLSQGDEVEFLHKGEHVTINRRENRIESAFGLCEARKSAGLEEIEKAIEEGATG
ncbi:MAG: AbrB/MazE/SpoVT family DNA-binding domain-containing protein [Acidobacteriota bacterium]